MRKVLIASATVCAIAMSGAATAQQQVYHPVNPNFGGNPLNGTFLMQNAQAQGMGLQQQQQQQFPNINFPDLSNVGSGSSTSPIIIIGGSTTTIPSSP